MHGDPVVSTYAAYYLMYNVVLTAARSARLVTFWRDSRTTKTYEALFVYNLLREDDMLVPVHDTAIVAEMTSMQYWPGMSSRSLAIAGHV